MCRYVFKASFVITLMMLMCISAMGQFKPSKKKHKHGAGHPVVAPPPTEKIFTSVVQPPEFQGGSPALQKYLHDHITYPSQARENGIQGNVVLSFFINEIGRIDDIRIEKGIGFGCDEEAIRVVSNMPQWRPYKREGKCMKMLCDLKIEFKLTE